MLYRLHNNFLIVGLLAIGFLSVMLANRAFCNITIVTVFAFVTQILLLLWVSDERRTVYSDKTIFITVLVYSFLLGCLFYVAAYYNDNLNLQLNDPDAALYYREGIKSNNLGLWKNAERIMTKYAFDDCGALLFTSFIMYFSPTDYILNIFYVFTGAISAVLLFRIGKKIMSAQYAYLAALTYSTSSFLILLHCTYLKESLFVLLVISAMYFFYQAIADNNKWALIIVVLFLIIIAFFRPAVDAFLLVSFACYYAITQRGSAISFFLYCAIFLGLIVSMTFLQSQLDSYTAGGDREAILTESGSSNYSGGFNFFVGWFSALFGPFPTLFPMEGQNPVPMHFYGAGLFLKLFWVVPLWIGIFFAIKKFEVCIIPLVVFIIVEMIASAYVMASLELRKVMLHIPFTYILSFYGLFQLEKREIRNNTIHLLEISTYVFTIGVLLLWNVIRVK